MTRGPGWHFLSIEGRIEPPCNDRSCFVGLSCHCARKPGPRSKMLLEVADSSIHVSIALFHRNAAGAGADLLMNDEPTHVRSRFS